MQLTLRISIDQKSIQLVSSTNKEKQAETSLLLLTKIIQFCGTFIFNELRPQKTDSDRPLSLASIHFHVDKFHSFFELVLGHIILPVFQSETGLWGKLNQCKMEGIHKGELFSSFMQWCHPCHIVKCFCIQWRPTQKLHHERMIKDF